MGREILIYTDEAGNRMYKKYIKTRGVWQYYGRNAAGGILSPSAYNTLARKAGMRTYKGMKPRTISRFSGSPYRKRKDSFLGNIF